MIELVIGYVLDFFIGDPQGAWHPVGSIGSFVHKLDNLIRPRCRGNLMLFCGGALTWCIVGVLTFLIPLLLLFFASMISAWLAFALNCMMCYYLLGTRALKDESSKVLLSLDKGDIEEARKNLASIIDRDTQDLDEEKMIKATVETIAKNTSDDVIAPMIYIFLGGAPLGFLYKGINKMDSMLGYKNEKYLYFGRFAARAEDIANFIPARITAFVMTLSAFFIKLDWKNAIKIYWRDRYKHKSLNDAHTAAVCAGALQVQLAGDRYYGGLLVEKATIGDAIHPVSKDDIVKANALLYMTSMLAILMGCALKVIV